MAEERDAGFSWRSPGLGLAVTLIAATVTLMVVFQTVQLAQQRSVLSGISANQEDPLREAARLRAQVEALAGETATLAAQGNRNAQIVQEQLRRAGIAIRPPAAGGAATSPPPAP